MLTVFEPFIAMPEIFVFSAVFLHFRGVTFKNYKQERYISLYKGYLSSGEHLKDLDRIRK